MLVHRLASSFCVVLLIKLRRIPSSIITAEGPASPWYRGPWVISVLERPSRNEGLTEDTASSSLVLYKVVASRNGLKLGHAMPLVVGRPQLGQVIKENIIFASIAFSISPLFGSLRSNASDRSSSFSAVGFGCAT